MKPPAMLCVTSPFEIEVSKNVGTKLWKAFMTGKNIPHSHLAGTLPFIIRRCEREKINYVLEAMPGIGYVIHRADAVRVEHLSAPPVVKVKV